MVVDQIEVSDIQLQITANNWEEAIKKTAKPLLNEGKITEKYIQAMIDSVHELGPYIVIAPGLALGHARPSAAVKQTSMALATLAEPVEFGNKQNDPVSLVVVIASVNSTDHLGLMQKVVTFLNEHNNLAALKQLPSNAAQKVAAAINEGTELDADS